MRANQKPLPVWLPLMLAYALATTPPAFAAGPIFDWQADTARILGDPSFLPLAGQVAGSFSYTYSAQLYDVENGPLFNGPVHALDRSGNAFLPALRYGITDDISVGAEFGWGNERNQNSFQDSFIRLSANPPSGGNPYSGGYDSGVSPPILVTQQVKLHSRSIGAENPVFDAAWRAVDQRRAPVSVDFSGSYSPDIFAARDTATDQTGSLALGGWRATLQAAVSRETRWLTVRVYAGFGYDGRRDIAEPGGFETIRVGAHPDYAMGVQDQARIVPWMAVNFGAGLQKSARYDNTFISSFGKSSETLKPGGTVSPYVSLLFPILRNRLVGQVGYQHDFSGDQQLESPGFTQRLFDREQNLYTARLLFAFGR